MSSTTSCTPQEPFIKLDPGGQASILNYNVPQETSFKANGYIRLDIKSSCFSAGATVAPAENFWDTVSDLPTSQIYQLLNDDVVSGAFSPSFVNAAFLHNMKLVRDETPRVGETRAGANSGPTIGSAKPGAHSGPMIGAPKPGANQTTVQENVASSIAGLTTSEVVNQIVKGRRPVISKNFYGTPVLSFMPKPKTPDPAIFLVFHYKITSFLGDYGAGKTLKTFSLLPGEKTTISLRTFRHKEETRTKSDHIFDSFSKSSADSLQSTVETETGYENESTKQKNKSAEFGGGLHVGLGKKAQLGLGGGVNSQTTTSSTFNTHMNQLQESIDLHTAETNAVREVEVNTDVTSTNIEEIEESTVRQIQNINLSRTLNFVYRQLLQKYLTITYLDDVSIVYTNGYPESRIVVKLNEINDLLSAVLEDGPGGSVCENVIENTRKGIYRQLCNIFDYQGASTSFMECVTQTLNDCCGGSGDPIENTFARKKLGLSQTHDGKTVPGIILNVTERILRTDSAVVDALLGQGEALDCYNQQLQNIAVEKAQLENDKVTMGLEILTGIDEAETKADKFKKVFGSCCEVAQSGCGCNCGGSSGVEEPGGGGETGH